MMSFLNISIARLWTMISRRPGIVHLLFHAHVFAAVGQDVLFENAFAGTRTQKI